MQSRRLLNSFNRFEPSQATLAINEDAARHAGDGARVWRDGRMIVMLPGAAMPRRCVKCNVPADEPTVARKVYWHSPWLYLLLLFNIIVFALVAVLVRKTAMVAPGLCVEHKKRRRIVIALSWTGALLGIVVMYVGMATPLGVWGAVLGMLVILASIVAGMIFGRVVYASRIDKSYVRLKGSGELFLTSLPPFPG